MPTALVTTVGNTAIGRPKRNIVAVRVIKPPDSPLLAPANPAIRQVTLMTIFVPKRSPSIPPIREKNILPKGKIPQTIPTCTRLKPKSSDISSKRTDIEINGMDITNIEVIATSVRIYHL